MTRKHFEAVAEIVKEELDWRKSMGQMVEARVVISLARRFAEMFEAENDRFDRRRFLRACGAGDEGSEE
jgi:hypothetical protein